ncbi:EFR1 family ferrodoxin [Candidatus Soleaferrea massiliensis]|uniref:EFR1 family ferrodoxin n=1 Tax=Candidatus Soleaferrea massiliensis TaxID=1470354 RepID=UPI000A6F6D92|nr:EFR1 family ferrodoxin [Candidatus Soleaferrea massiliensis]
MALQIAKIISDDEIVSVNQYLKSGGKAAIQSERPLVFVAPTYSWRMPRVVEQWILETSFRGSRDAYFILTCGGGCGNAAAYARKLCVKKNWRFCGLAPVIMPENYLALFPTPEEAECRSIADHAQPSIAALAERIRAGECFDKPAVTFGERLQSGPVNPLFYTFFVRDTGFTVSDRCISCGKCASRCPLNNIDLKAGKPTWNGSCTHCMACIGGCPAEAIEYKSKSRKRHRHYIMNDALCWGSGGQVK